MSVNGLRGRLVAVIVLVAATLLAVSFLVLHARTGTDLETRIDDGLASDLGEFNTSAAAQAGSPGELRRLAKKFVDGQAYHPDSRIFAIEIDGTERVVTNSEELIESELGESEQGDDDSLADAAGAAGILSAQSGYQTVRAGGDARVRVLTQPIEINGRQVGEFHVAQSLSQVATTEETLESNFLVLGGIALLLLVLAAVWIATLLVRPLDRITGFAAGIDRGDLGRRLDATTGSREVKSLSTSLNRMLDRLQGAFEREREFVADASHELRTPITIAKGEIDLLRRESASAEGERLAVIRRELVRMERLIADMLSLAQEDAGRSLEIRTVPLDDLLDDLRRDLPLLGPRHYRVATLEGTVEADPDRLAQVLRNLTRNAVAHTAEGGVVDVAASAEGDRVRFAVSDDGPGIEEGAAAHLFERFYRSPETRAREGEGSGLGLAIARAIVEAHGGRIWATPGAGGLVEFELPNYSRVSAAEASATETR